MNEFKNALLKKDGFIITCELIPGRGFKGKGIDQVLHFAEDMVGVKEVHALSLTDNAGGNPALSADVLGTEILAMGVDLIVHFSCKDMNRNVIESRAYALQRFGITNLLIITGDYPITGFFGLPKPVFDIDSVSALHYLSEMNRGLEVTVGRKNTVLEASDLFLGACVSPFKWTEGPCKMQYLKMEKKIQAGAHYFITQLGYDSRKYTEMIRFARDFLKTDVPVLGSVYVLSLGAARYMNRGEVPGCYVDDRLVANLEREAKSEDKGRGARLERASKQLAILKGLGFNGAHIEGLNLKSGDVKHIIARAAETGDRWEEFLEEFASAPASPYYLFDDGDRFAAPASNVEREPDFNRTRRKFIISATFWATRLLHVLFFKEGTVGYRFMRMFSRFIEHRKFFYEIFSFFEKTTKKFLFSCRECDDCALFEMYYLCPESRCPKGMRQGPCGGSRVNGRCEVFEQNKCVWDMVYWRAKNRGECEKLRYIIPPRDWKLYETNSWVNYFLKYDHSGKKVRIPENSEISLCDRDHHKDGGVENEAI